MIRTSMKGGTQALANACPYEETRRTYADAEGAAAYATNDSASAALRDKSAWSLLDGIDVRGMRILDMGCGPGRDVAEMRRRGAVAWGVDASPALLAEAMRRHGNPDWWLQGDMLSDDVPRPAILGVDLVWSQASLVHVPPARTGEVVSRWVSWLAPGGRIAVATKEGVGEAHDVRLGTGLPRRMAYRTLEEVVAVMEGAGLTVEVARSGIPGHGTRESFLAVRARRP